MSNIKFRLSSYMLCLITSGHAWWHGSSSSVHEKCMRCGVRRKRRVKALTDQRKRR